MRQEKEGSLALHLDRTLLCLWRAHVLSHVPCILGDLQLYKPPRMVHASRCDGEGAGMVVRCRMVGLPWGQFHGCSVSPICFTTLCICRRSNAEPTMMLFRHARLASISCTLLHRTRSTPYDDVSRSCDRSSSKSLWGKLGPTYHANQTPCLC